MNMRHQKEPADVRVGRMIAEAIRPLKRDIAALRADLDAMEDAAAIRLIENAPAEERFPAAVAAALVRGDHPVKVFRNHRNMTQEDLAAAIGSSAAYISQIENRDRNAGTKTMKKLAEALAIDAADLAIE